MSEVVRAKIEDYFSTMNPTSSRMMADIITSKEKYKNEWDTLPEEEQSEIIWRAIVKSDDLKKYEELQQEKPGVDCFPVLRIKPGEKIVIDEDGRPFGCSWRDEHSAPFRWETQSQLDMKLEGGDLDEDHVRTLEKVPAKTAEPEKAESKKEEQKRSIPVKRPEVPPPPVPPHVSSPVLPRSEHTSHPTPPVLPQAEKTPPPQAEKDNTPIYAKVVKRKSGCSKTLVLSEMKAHRRAKEEMKPAVPPRMSLELKGEVNITKYKTLPIDFEDIPKTGFDFLDNW